MESNIENLLRKQPYLRAREQVLLTRLRSAEPSSIREIDIIDEITFREKKNDGIQHVASQGSRTEYAALNMDQLQADEKRKMEERILHWEKELKQVRHSLSILDGALLALTMEERVLVTKYYFEGSTLEAISEEPLVEVIRSKSTLKRMLKNIRKKLEEVMTHEETISSILPENMGQIAVRAHGTWSD